MSRKSGAQAGEGKLESRFAALTSGLLARKGQAAPSNSPIADPAEETEAFTPGDALIPRKLAPKDAKGKTSGPGLTPLHNAARPVSHPVAQPAAQTLLRPAPPAPAPAAATAKAPMLSSPERAAPIPVPSPVPSPVPRPPAQKPPPKAAAQSAPPPKPLTVINERSYEAGYPDNPSAEDIAAMEAEADEVVSYFEQMGAAASAASEDHFFDDEDMAQGTPPPPAMRDPLEELDDEIAALNIASSMSASAPASGPAYGPASASASALWVASAAPKPAQGSPARASVSAQLTVREFMRLSLGAVELDLPPEALVAEAIEEYLDARGIDSLGDNEFLQKLAALSAENQRDGA